MPRSRASVQGRFTVTDRGCWQWTGPVDRNGYGKFGKECAHRRSYEEFVGPIPDGLTIDHLCRNHGCVNPEHLEPVTHAENQRRRYALVTHCLRGHEFNEENTRVRVRDGYVMRECRVCQRDRNRAKYAERVAERTHCAQGHELRPETTFVSRFGRLERVTCRICYRASRSLSPADLDAA